jgi:quercetin dioxygenase-like cupin family protein
MSRAIAILANALVRYKASATNSSHTNLYLIMIVAERTIIRSNAIILFLNRYSSLFFTKNKIMENSKEPITIVNAKEGTALSVVGDSYRIVMSGKQTGGAYAVIDMLIPPGGGPGPHAHAGFQETFYVLDGEVEVKTEDGTYTAEKGSFTEIPLGGLIHFFKNKTDKVAHLWCVVVPAGLDDFFQEIGKPGTFGTFVPPPPMNPEAMKKLTAIAEKHGQQIFPSDYLDKKKSDSYAVAL